MAKSRDNLLESLTAEQVQWQAFLDAAQSKLEAMPADTPSASGEWTLKDLIAHLTTWWHIDIAEIQAGCGQPSDHLMPWPVEFHWNPHRDQDHINDWIYKHNRNRPWQEVLRDARGVINQMIATIRSRSDEELYDPHCFEWLHGRPLTEIDWFSHRREEHRSDIVRLMAAEQS